MTPRSLLLCVLVLQSLLCTVLCSPVCNNQCCRFVEGFPVRLKELKKSFSHIRDFYEANDALDTALLDQSVEESFKTAFACQAMNSILGFYLDTVLPTALADETEDATNLKPPMQSIQQILDQLKTDVHTCMESKGMYKAMGELDLLFSYIETYLASKRRGTHTASA